MNSPSDEIALDHPAVGHDRRALPTHGLQLHLGSGPEAHEGWISVDKSLVARVSRSPWVAEVLARVGVLSEQQRTTRWPDEVVQMDLAKRFPWDDDSARAIYSSHMVEHLSRTQARHVLGQCLRVLVPGGVLRLVLPNLNGAVARYLDAKRAGNPRAADALVEFLYMAPEQGEVSLLRRAGYRLLHRPHLWMYDAESLAVVLEDTGFVAVTQCDFREGACPDLSSIETRSDDLFEGDSFYLEASKRD
jgi:SAM-dependent methyltransferase